MTTKADEAFLKIAIDNLGVIHTYFDESSDSMDKLLPVLIKLKNAGDITTVPNYARLSAISKIQLLISDACKQIEKLAENTKNKRESK